MFARSRAYLIIPLVAWAILAGWLWRDCRQKMAADRASLRAQGEAILLALEAGIRSLNRFQLDRNERLKATLEELAKTPFMIGIAILDQHGDPITAGGSIDRWKIDVASGEREWWDEDALLLLRPIEMAAPWIGRPPFGRRTGRGGPGERERSGGPGEGPGERFGGRPEERTPVFALLALSQGQLAAIMRQHIAMALLSSAVGLAAALVLAAAWRGSIRNREQAAALQVAEAQNVHFRELQATGAGLAHEMKNPLNIVRGTAQALLEEGDRPAPDRHALERMLEEIDRIVSRLNAFLSFSHLPKPEPVPCSAHEVVSQVAALLRHGLESPAVQIVVDPLPGILADPVLFRQIVFNLLHNGVRSVGDAGTVRVSSVERGASRIRLEVSDTGIGVPEQLRERLFQPYCSGWEGGTGLGLSIVRQLAIAHGWEVGYRPNDDRGSIFWISNILRADDAARETAPPHAA